VKIFWLVVAGLCIVAAGFFLLRGDFSTAFVVAALGLVSWFLNYRLQMKEITAAADLEESKADNGKGVNDSDEN
jgi:hypothetical protein